MIKFALATTLALPLFSPAYYGLLSESPTTIVAEQQADEAPSGEIAIEIPPKPIEQHGSPVVKAESKKQREHQQNSRKEISQSWQTFEASYYTSNCYSCSGVTKSGYSVKETIYYKGMRVIATDPKILPLGTVVEVATDYGSFKAISLDTGGRIKSKVIDILVESEEEAYKLGRHPVRLRVIGKVEDI